MRVNQMNLCLSDDAWASFVAHNNVLVGVMIVGQQAFRDSYGIDNSGAPTYDRVMRVSQVGRKHGVR